MKLCNQLVEQIVVGTAHVVCRAGSMQLAGVRLSVCPICLPQAAAVGLAARQYQWIAAWPMVHNTVHSSKCWQYHVVSRRTRLNTDLFLKKYLRHGFSVQQSTIVILVMNYTQPCWWHESSVTNTLLAHCMYQYGVCLCLVLHCVAGLLLWARRAVGKYRSIAAKAYQRRRSKCKQCHLQPTYRRLNTAISLQ